MNYANVFDPKTNHYLPSHAKVSATHSNFLQVPSTGKTQAKESFYSITQEVYSAC